MPPPVLLGLNRPIDLTVPVPLTTATVFHQCEPIFVRLTAPDQNLNRNAADTALVTIADSATGDGRCSILRRPVRIREYSLVM